MGLNGSISLSGTAIFGNPTDMNPAQTSLGFDSAQIDQATGDFAGGNFNSVSLETLSLTREGESGPIYNFDSTSGFINFGSQNLDGTGSKELTFNLDAGQLMRFSDGQDVSEFTFQGLTGTFRYGGATIASGFLGATKTGDAQGFDISLTAQSEAVPEPLTILGTGVALGFGAMFKNKSTANRNK